MSLKLPLLEDHPEKFVRAADLRLYRAWCYEVDDGDSYKLELDAGLYQPAVEAIRLRDLDSPEIFRPRNDAERFHGEAARARARELILEKHVLVRTEIMSRKGDEQESLARFVADVYHQADSKVTRPPEMVLEEKWWNLALTLRDEGYAKRESYT